MPFTFVAELKRLREKLRRHPSGETLVLFVDGELPEAHRRDVDAHLRRCEDCRLSVDEFDHFLHAAGNFAEDPPPALMSDMLQGILAAIGAAPRRDPSWTADGLRDLALCVGTDEAVAIRRHESPDLAVTRLAALLGSPAARAFVDRNGSGSRRGR